MSTGTLEAAPQHVLAANVRALLARRGTSSRSFADDLGVSPVWLSRRIGLSPSVDVTLNDAQRIADALDVALADLLTP